MNREWDEESNKTKSTQKKFLKYMVLQKLNMNPNKLHSIVHVKYVLI